MEQNLDTGLCFGLAEDTTGLLPCQDWQRWDTGAVFYFHQNKSCHTTTFHVWVCEMIFWWSGENAPLPPATSPANTSIFTLPCLSLTLLLPSFPYKDPGDYVESIWITQDNLSISRSLTSSHLQNTFCNVIEHIHRFWGLGSRHIWEVIILSVTSLHLLPLPTSIFSITGIYMGILKSLKCTTEFLIPRLDTAPSLKHCTLSGPSPVYPSNPSQLLEAFPELSRWQALLMSSKTPKISSRIGFISSVRIAIDLSVFPNRL